MEQIDIIVYVAELLTDEEINTDFELPITTATIDRSIEVQVIRDAKAIVEEALKPQPEPTSMEIFEQSVSIARSAFSRIATELRAIEASPFHNGISKPLVQMREESSNGIAAACNIEEHLADLKRRANGIAEAGVSGRDASVGSAGT